MAAGLHVGDELGAAANDFFDGHGAVGIKRLSGKVAVENDVAGDEARVFPELARTAQREDDGMKAIGEGFDHEIDELAAIVKDEIAAGGIENGLEAEIGFHNQLLEEPGAGLELARREESGTRGGLAKHHGSRAVVDLAAR